MLQSCFRFKSARDVATTCRTPVMPVPADAAARGGNAAAADAEMSSSCSSTTSSSSHSDPERASGAKRVACPPRRPGFQRLGQLGFLEMSELRERRRAAQRALAARAVTTADTSRKERREPGSGPQPPTMNYGGAGRFIAGEILRSVFRPPVPQAQLPPTPPPMFRSDDSPKVDSPSEWSPPHADAKALLDESHGYWLGILRHRAARLPSSLSSLRTDFSSWLPVRCSVPAATIHGLRGRRCSRRCNEPVMTLSEFTAAFQCDSPNLQH
ncbi:hypothetical protein V5799_029171 [Amblyomma americanum]|uniref:Uncharacterized protein n=1 Tax=Amblyomma americanum TaxID=6943 RepID=A0AAQ4ERS1_AMBAM